MRVYYDRDADVNLIKSKKVAIIGYGSQGHAHALNLKDSGVKEVAVALRPGSASAAKAEAEGLKVMSPADAAKWADMMMMLTPDELQASIYEDSLRDNMREGTALAFAHGLNIHFNLIDPRPDLDIFMIAPKGYLLCPRGSFPLSACYASVATFAVARVGRGGRAMCRGRPSTDNDAS